MSKINEISFGLDSETNHWLVRVNNINFAWCKSLSDCERLIMHLESVERRTVDGIMLFDEDN